MFQAGLLPLPVKEKKATRFEIWVLERFCHRTKTCWPALKKTFTEWTSPFILIPRKEGPPTRTRKEGQEERWKGRWRLVSIVSLWAISSPFDSFFKVLCIFPSRYLCAIGLWPVFSLGRKLPPQVRTAIPSSPTLQRTDTTPLRLFVLLKQYCPRSLTLAPTFLFISLEQDCHLLWCPFPGRTLAGDRSDRVLNFVKQRHNSKGLARGRFAPDSRLGLIPFHSQLLRESL